MTFEQQKNTKAISITIGTHLVLLLFFLFFKYTMPAQSPVDEMGMEVNLGTSEDGFGTDQPEDMNDPAAMGVPVSLASESEIKQLNKEIQTTDDINEPAVAVKKQSEKAKVNPTQNKTVHATATTTKAPDPKYVFKGWDGKGGNSAQNNKEGGNEGIGSGDGDMGVPGGTPGAKNYSGTPGSGNMSYSLNNRTLVSRPDKNASFRQGGRVVVSVTVNPDGEIIAHSIKSAANSEIRSLALQKLKSVRFNKTVNARPEEFGTITFEFK